MSDSSHRGYRHEAWFYRNLEGFLATVVPFIQDGVAQGQPVMVAVTGQRLAALRAAFSATAGQVHFADMAVLGRNPARIIPAWLEFVAANCADDKPVRGVGEPIWAGRSPAEISECQLHEGLLNVAVSPDTPLWLVCPYDMSALDTAVIDEAHHSHPVLRESITYRGSTSYGGAYYVQNLFRADLADSTGITQSVAFSTRDVQNVRPWITGTALNLGMSVDRAEQLGAALLQIATDSIRNGGGRGLLRTWAEGPMLICEVSDFAVVSDPMVGRGEAPPGAGDRHGLWSANQVCDLIQTRSNSAGTTIRVHSAIGTSGGAEGSDIWWESTPEARA